VPVPQVAGRITGESNARAGSARTAGPISIRAHGDVADLARVNSPNNDDEDLLTEIPLLNIA